MTHFIKKKYGLSRDQELTGLSVETATHLFSMLMQLNEKELILSLPCSVQMALGVMM
jgi:hypothetical protein